MPAAKKSAPKPSIPSNLKAPGATRATEPKPEVKKIGLGLKVTPKDAMDAIELLSRYIEERALLAGDKARLGNTVGAVRIMAAIDDLKSLISQKLKTPLEEAYNHMRFTIVPSMMEEEGIDKITVDDVGRVNVTDDVQVSVLDKPALHEWLTENDHEDMLQANVHAQTLAAFVRNSIKEGKSQDGKGLPEDTILKITPIVRAAITRN